MEKKIFIPYQVSLIKYFFWLIILYGLLSKASAQSTRIFAIIGDYGSKGSDEEDVADLVKSWKPEYILTLGDNNYPDGAASTIDGNIGKYYHRYIKSYKGSYGSGSDYGRFYPCIGNHDWSKKYGIKPYLDYFSLPGNERYYDFVKGNIHFFVLNSESHEPDGVSSSSKQAMWLKNKLRSSSAKWKIVYFHHSPYCSGDEAGSQEFMRWPFKYWGADIVLSGHSHVYERVSKDGFPYLVNGLGGEHKAGFDSRVSGSKVRYSDKFGAIKVIVKPDTVWFKFYNVSKKLIDSYPLVKKNSNAPTPSAQSKISNTNKKDNNLSTDKVIPNDTEKLPNNYTHAQPIHDSTGLNTKNSGDVYTPNTFAVIGDYGLSGPNEAAVASLVNSWSPNYIITLGDNNYPSGDSNTIDDNVGKYYQRYIKPYMGAYGKGADTNRFFPSLGNHDWMSTGALPYLQYFTLPGNERYYDFVKGNIHFFVLDSDPQEPDSVSKTSVQALWLKNKMMNSKAKWKIVYFHHSPYSSDQIHGGQDHMRWPFKSWGADIVLSGHSHIYERVVKDNFPYIVNGLGGQAIYQIDSLPIQGSQIRYNGNFGAMKVTVNPDTLWFRFYAVSNQLIDTYPLVKTVIGIGKNVNLNDSTIIIYPNPSTGLFTFEICLEDIDEENVDVKILNTVGQAIYNRAFASRNNCIKEIIELQSDLAAGAYFLQIKMKNKEIKTKIVLNR